MMRFFALLFYAGFGLFPAALAEGDRPVLVELFASQNCAACPKAYKNLKRLQADGENLLVLTWSVDYWDYLGEPDPMALPEAKVRQDAYADNLGLRAPYTPQSIYDGIKQCPATGLNGIKRAITNARDQRPAGTPRPRRLSQTESGIAVADACEQPLDIYVVEYLPDAAHQTGSVNPVTASQKIGTCSDATSNNGMMLIETNCTGHCAILLQEPAYGAVVDTLIWK